MRLSAIFSDRTIVKDGVAVIFRPEADYPAVDANWHALQWYDEGYGTIEVKVGNRIWLTEDEFGECVGPFSAAFDLEQAAQAA